MQTNEINSINQESEVRPLIILIIFTLFIEVSWGGIEEGVEESYEVRPDIMQIDPEGSTKLDSVWDMALNGHIEAVAMLLEMYHDYDIYFIARDAEHLYDVTRMAKQHDSKLNFGRIHLINVSRGNLEDLNLPHYLHQEGISAEDLKRGKKVVFVDTGLRGSIPMAIQEMFPEYRDQLQVQLMASQNFDIPSTRVFLNSFASEASRMSSMEFSHLITKYEHISRYTSRSFRFEKEGRRWHAVSYIPMGAPERKSRHMSAKEMLEFRKNIGDNPPHRNLAKAYMADLRHHFEHPETQKHFQTRREQWKRIRNSLDKRDKEVFTQVALDLLENASPQEVPIIESMIRDGLEIASLNFKIPYRHLPSFEGILRLHGKKKGKECKTSGQELGGNIQDLVELAPLLHLN